MALCEAGKCDHPECLSDRTSRDPMEPGDAALAVMDELEDDWDSNARRAARAFLAFFPSYDDWTLEQGIKDFLSDLRHLCDLADLDLGELDRLAHALYLEERGDCGIASHEAFKASIHHHITEETGEG